MPTSLKINLKNTQIKEALYNDLHVSIGDKARCDAVQQHGDMTCSVTLIKMPCLLLVHFCTNMAGVRSLVLLFGTCGPER